METYEIIGKDIARNDAKAKATAKAVYADDIKLAGMCGLIAANHIYSASLHRKVVDMEKMAALGEMAAVVDMDAIRSAGVQIGIDPLGGSGVRYWPRIADEYGLDLTVVNAEVDATFRFMRVDWDGRIRMDCSSPHAMAGLIGMKDRFDVAFGNDTDADRHGIVTRSAGLMNPNHYLSVAIWYLYQHRPGWRADAAVGKTLVSSSMIDRVAADLGRRLGGVGSCPSPCRSGVGRPPRTPW